MRLWCACLMAVSLCTTAAAQSPPADTDGQLVQQRRPVSRRARRQPLAFRGFGLLAAQTFTARTSFDGIFGSSAGLFFGGGAQIILPQGVFGEVSVSRFSRTGERAFLNEGQTFQLGIPLKATITPVEVTAGYRFRLRKHPKLVPYAGAGVGSYAYKETSNFEDDVSIRHIGYLGVAGVEVRAQRWIALDFAAHITHIPGILGSDGISKDADEHDLGGTAFQFRVIVGPR